MEVTLFVEDEKAPLIAEPDDWRKKCEELGLEGQISMCEPGKSPIPFKLLSRGEFRAILAVCPQSALIKSYKGEPIPMKVLGMVALAVQENYFTEIKIWHPVRGADPFVIGYADNNEYLIAQWGPEAFSWEKIMEKARAILTNKVISKCREQIADYQVIGEHPENEVEKYLNGDWVVTL